MHRSSQLSQAVCLLCCVFTLTTANAFGADRPAQPCLKGLQNVRISVKLDLDDAATQSCSPSILRLQHDLQDLLTTGGFTVDPNEQHVTVTWRVKIRKFQPQIPNPAVATALAGVFVYQVDLSVQQDVIFVRPAPALPLPITLNSFVGSANTWNETEGGFGLTAVVLNRLPQVLAEKLELLVTDWRAANP